MRLLVLGGTVFLGRHLVSAALAAGHQVTLFNRGRTDPGLFPGLETLIGDRDGGLAPLGGRTWDAVLDTCGFVPRVVADSARALAGAVGHYCFVSSVSVYAEPMTPGADEEAPLAPLAEPATETLDAETYGPLKAACESAVLEALPGRASVVRPGLIVGPHDPTGRFGYWPLRVHRGGEVLAPGPAGAPVQFIDVRDLAEWMIRLVGEGMSGTFNATGPATPLTMRGLVEACRGVAAPGTRVTWVHGSFLIEQGVRPWTDLPLWLPPSMHALSQLDSGRAVARGLTFRPLADTVRDTLEWELATPPEARRWKPRIPMPGPLDPERESELLAAWQRVGRRRD